MGRCSDIAVGGAGSVRSAGEYDGKTVPIRNMIPGRPGAIAMRMATRWVDSLETAVEDKDKSDAKDIREAFRSLPMGEWR